MLAAGLSHTNSSVNSVYSPLLSFQARRRESPRTIFQLRKQRISFSSILKISTGKARSWKKLEFLLSLANPGASHTAVWCQPNLESAESGSVSSCLEDAAMVVAQSHSRAPGLGTHLLSTVHSEVQILQHQIEALPVPHRIIDELQLPPGRPVCWGSLILDYPGGLRETETPHGFKKD